MNPRLWMIFWIGSALVLLSNCGVKGDPLPPLQPHVTENVNDKFGEPVETKSHSEAEEAKDK